jgi:hypothetical protein
MGNVMTAFIGSAKQGRTCVTAFRRMGLLLFAALVLTFAGCGGGSTSSSPPVAYT